MSATEPPVSPSVGHSPITLLDTAWHGIPWLAIALVATVLVAFLIVLLALFISKVGPDKVARKIYELLNKAVTDATGRFTVVSVFVAIAAAVWFGLHSSDMFDKLKDSGYARGVITYCITIATIGLAFILALQAMFVKPETEEKFKGAREILTVLMGVLGTIVGFYFGSTAEQGKALRIVQLAATQAEGREHVTAYVEGGAIPYNYTVTTTLADNTTKPITGQSVTGLISEDAAVGAKPATAVRLEVVDAKNGMTVKSADTTVGPAPASPSTSPSPTTTPPASSTH